MGQIKNEALLKQIAKRLKALREAKSLSQEELYNDTAINIGRIESAKANISVSTLDALCTYFEISLEEFFGGMTRTIEN